MTEQRVDTSRHAHVLLDIGGDAGALVIHTRPELDGVEIEVSPHETPSARVHAQVHRRDTGGDVSHAAVYPTLQAGSYIVWRTSADAWADVSVRAGRVTEVGLL